MEMKRTMPSPRSKCAAEIVGSKSAPDAGKRCNSRRNAAVLSCMLLFLLLGLAFWLWKDVFVLRRVTVLGGSADAEAVIAAAGVERGVSVFALNEAAAREGVNALGEVCLEEYRLQLPDGLLLRIRDRKPVAMLPCTDGLLLIDCDCCAIALVQEAPDTDLLYVSGVTPSRYQSGQAVNDEDGRMDLCRSIFATLEALHAAMYVSEIDLSDADALRLITRGGICVELGAGALEDQLALMEAAVADLESRGTMGGCLHVEDGRAFYSPMNARMQVSESVEWQQM